MLSSARPEETLSYYTVQNTCGNIIPRGPHLHRVHHMECTVGKRRILVAAFVARTGVGRNTGARRVHNESWLVVRDVDD